MPTPPVKIDAKRWRCDICEDAYFDDFEDAVRHEEQCESNTKMIRDRQNQQHGRGLQFDDDNDNYHHNTSSSNSKSSSSSSSSSKNVHPFFTQDKTTQEVPMTKGERNVASSRTLMTSLHIPGFVSPPDSSSSTEEAAATGATTTERKSKTTNTITAGANPKPKSIGSFFLPKGEKDESEKKTNGLSRLSSQTTGDDTAISNSRNDAKNTSDRKRKHNSSGDHNDPTTTKGTTTATSSSSSTTTTSNTKKTIKQLKTLDDTTTTTAKNPPRPKASSKNNNNNKQKKSSQQQQKTTTKSKTTKRGTGGSTASTSCSSSKSPLADIIKFDEPKLASIFQNKSAKEILAEQRLAEFQAKRDAERRRERDRQAKRALIFDTKTKKNVNDDDNDLDRNDTISNGSSDKSLKRKAAATSVSTSATSTTTTTPKMSMLPIAPRFPVPNHVLGEGDGSYNRCRPASNKLSTGDTIKLDKVWNNATSSSPGELLHEDGSSIGNKQPAETIKLLPSLSALDVTTPTSTMIQQAFSDTLVRPQKASVVVDEESKKCWDEKYGMDHGLVGSDSQQVYQQLVETINYWKSARNEVLKRMAERQRKFQAKNGISHTSKKKTKQEPKKKKKKGHHGYGTNDFIVDDDEDYELDDDDELSKLSLLVGPSSSGKTSLVHHVAQKHNCAVVEINTSTVRSGAALKRSIQEATQSTSSVGKFQTKTSSNANSIFAPKAKENVEFPKNTSCHNKRNGDDGLFDSEDEDDDSVEHSRKMDELQKVSLTIILIDEVDILFEDDLGFWGALASVVKTTKCPIILTANQYPPNVFNSTQFPCQFIETKRPSPLECAKKVLQVCHHEGIEIQPHLRSQGAEMTHEQLAWVAKVCGCDLRRMMFELQLFAVSSSAPSSFHCQDKVTKKMTQCNKHCKPVTSFKQEEWRPVVLSLEPSAVPMDNYSIITLRGSNLSLLKAKSDTTVWIGHNKCQHQVVDDGTMLVLCPPCSANEPKNDEHSTYSTRLVKRAVPISLECPSFGMCKSFCPSQIVVMTELINDNKLYETSRLSLLYEYPENYIHHRGTESEDEIEEFDGSDDKVKSESQIQTCSKPPSREEVEALWQAALSKATPIDQVEPSNISGGIPRPDHAMVDTLEEQSCNAANHSDAAVLEDELHGLPYLAGACRGFAFDYTEECVGKTQPDMLRMRDNSRPPPEEKLVELGWKDDCGFYGDSDALMTLPSSAHCRRQMNDVLNRFRGCVAVAGTLAVETSQQTSFDPNDILSREDLDRFALEANTVSGEDQYLPYSVPAIVQQLPELLRTIKSDESTKGPDYPFFEQRQAECIERAQNWTRYILPHSAELANWSYGRFGSLRVTDLGEYELYGDGREVLELMPMFRRIGVLEQAAEYAAAVSEQQQEASCRRSVRRRNGRSLHKTRHHYLDRLSVKLRRDESDVSSSELGTQLAEAFIKY
jgi:IPT/TIG domain